MKLIKNYLLMLAALVFVTLGAAMPYLVSRIQDSQLNEFQKQIELNSVSLTLQQELEDTVPALELISKKYTETPWEGDTALNDEIALQSAFKAVEAMDRYGLLPDTMAVSAAAVYDGDKALTPGTVSRSDASGEDSESILLVDGDGNLSLIWSCEWIFDDYRAVVSVDDATGKVVRVLFDSLSAEYNLLYQDIELTLDSWKEFFQDYFGGSVIYVEPTSSSGVIRKDDAKDYSYEYDVRFAPDDGSELYYFTLKIASDYAALNYK